MRHNFPVARSLRERAQAAASPQPYPPQQIESALKEGVTPVALPEQDFERQGHNKKAKQRFWILRKLAHGAPTFGSG